jgi:hypothetical protein
MVAVAVVVPLLVMCAAVGSVLLRKRRGTVRRLRRERAAALAGARVDLAAALTPHLARELSRSLGRTAVHERTRLVEELVTFVSGSPARVQLAEQLPGDEQALRMWFNGGWQLVLRGMARSSRDGLLKAARSGLVVTGAELVEVFGNRIRLHWTNTDGAGHTFVQIAALQRPVASTGGARRRTAS